MKTTRICSAAVSHLSVLTLCSLLCHVASASLIENFDGGGTGVPFELTNTSGGAPSIVAGGGGTGSFARLTNLNVSNNNSIAWDEDPQTTGPAPGGIKLAFDFRMTDDDANSVAGGCCGSAADGLGIGLFATSTYGSTGSVNPMTMGQGSGTWERPAFNDAFTVGLNIFPNIDEVTLNWGGAEVAVADVQAIMDLNNNTFHRAIVEIKPAGANALVDMLILEDVDGNTNIHTIFTGEFVTGMALYSLPNYRLIAGGRTGDAFVAGDLDNIALYALYPIPEPSVLVLLGGGLAVLGGLRQFRKN